MKVWDEKQKILFDDEGEWFIFEAIAKVLDWIRNLIVGGRK